MFNGQSQKGGDDSINQQANNGGVNQNAGRDINIYAKPEQDLGIIADIFKYIFDNKIEQIDISKLKENKKFLQLKDKIEINFSDESKKEINDILKINWGRMNVVERYIEKNNDISPEKISALILKIKSVYREKKSCEASDTKIENINVLDVLAKEFLPEDKISNPDYYASSMAIVLYFFQMCEIGKTKNE